MDRVRQHGQRLQRAGRRRLRGRGDQPHGRHPGGQRRRRGTTNTEYKSSPANERFYGTQYQADDFHSDCSISSYGDRRQVQRCKLSGLPDLDTGKADVQAELRGYLQALIDAGRQGLPHRRRQAHGGPRHRRHPGRPDRRASTSSRRPSTSTPASGCATGSTRPTAT
ncbi:MAG: hypothetical protein V9H69_11160 [Anaerolineae bacterium]